MSKKSTKKKCIDLYSGIGGWALGFKLCGIEITKSFEWWSDAAITHDINLNLSTDQCNIREQNPKRINEKIDFLVGSPPCTQFSYSNRGGSGNIKDGLKDISKFLEFVKVLKPKYWAMENVPRVANVISRELNTNGFLKEFRDICSNSMIHIYDFSEFGLPQKRKRCIVGNFDHKLLESYKSKIKNKNLGDVISSISKKQIFDPNFQIVLSNNKVTDLEKETPLNKEEQRFNSESKTHHPVYNNMQFPDLIDRPARTITATCTRVSRESIIINDNKKMRRLTVRERASCQGFPINFQFHSKSYSSKLKMIGNAISPVFTYYLANAMLGTNLQNLTLLDKVTINCINLKSVAPITKPETTGKSYPETRLFRFAIPNLRFKSGTRFELNNSKGKLPWKIEFFFGDSKRILSKKLDTHTSNDIFFVLSKKKPIITKKIKKIISLNIQSLDHNTLQNTWSGRSRKQHPFELIDKLGLLAKNLIDLIKACDNLIFDKILEKFVFVNVLNGKPISANKLKSYSKEITVGLIIGSEFNKINK